MSNENIEVFAKEQIKDWGRYSGRYAGEDRTYLAPRDGIWLSGRDVLVEKAYRLMEEDECSVVVREIQSSETSAVVSICRQEIRRMLNKNKE
jgi:hypothetical protein